MLVLAHAGHWLVQLLYFVPVVAFAIYVVIHQVRDRRDRGRKERGEGGEPRLDAPGETPAG